MQKAETVLNVLRERGRRGLPCDELYRQLFNKELYLLAYGRLYSNHGAMTPGADGETVDGMSLGKIDHIIDAMRHERYRFQPAKRVYIPKKDGKKRPLALPSWSDKLVGEVVRLLLEAYYEPQFSDRSHGFRPGRGCHTALSEVQKNWPGTTWFIEADISDCFGSLDHQILLSILGERIKDARFLRLIKGMLEAGYLEDMEWNATFSGAPQGGVVSPVLSNIYLDKLDKYVEETLIPQYTRKEQRAANPAYKRVAEALRQARIRGDRHKARRLCSQQRSLPSKDPQDPGFRRLRYCRYADDQLFGFIGPKAEAEEIKRRLTRFLHEQLGLELNQDKTLVTHARTGAARFLGYDITVQHNDTRITGGRRSANGVIGLRVPAEVIKAKIAPHYKRGKPAHRASIVNETDHQIVATFGAEYRGLVGYYLLAGNVNRLNRVRYVMETALLKTLACKHKTTVNKMAARHKAKISTPHGLRTCFEASVQRDGRPPLTARFGGIPLVRNKDAVLADQVPVQPPRRKELILRLLNGTCEACGKTGERVHVHQVRKLADLQQKGQPQPAWAQLMARRRRKTLIVCASCHDSIHTTQPPAQAPTTQ
jgi:group II intron reverse transcriptase/maturase